MKTSRSLGRRLLSLLLLICLVFPQVQIKKETIAHATIEETNLIAPENSEGVIRNGEYVLSSYTFDNNTLVLTNTYHFEPGPLTTYYTVDTIWSKNSTREEGRKMGYPKESGVEGVDWVRTNVKAVDTEIVMDESYSEYTYSQNQIKSMLRRLFGELQADTEYTIYMSEIFVKKQRYADGSSKLYTEQYDNIDDIRAAAAWTDTTWEQFEAYYDIPLTFKLQGGEINVICVDMDYGYSEIDRTTNKVVLGESLTIVPQAKLQSGEDELTYAGLYNISYGTEECTLEKSGGPGRVTMTNPEIINVFLGYRRVTNTPTLQIFLKKLK